MEKPLFFVVRCVVWLSLASSACRAFAAPAGADPILGQWIWLNDSLVTVNADGTTITAHGTRGAWTFQGNNGLERMYRFKWGGLDVVDDAVLSRDGQSLSVHNQKKMKWECRRAGMPPAVVASSPPAPAPDVLPASAASRSQYVGSWVVLFHPPIDHWQLEFNADGTCADKNGPFSHWEIKNNQLTITFDKDPKFVDIYQLPLRDGVLKGENRFHERITLKRLGTPTPATVKQDIAGVWTIHNARDGFTATATIDPEGRISYSDGRTSIWEVFDDHLVCDFGEARGGWHDVYYLPSQNGVLKGRNKNGDPMTLTRPGVAVPPVTSQPPAPARGTPSYFGTATGR